MHKWYRQSYAAMRQYQILYIIILIYANRFSHCTVELLPRWCIKTMRHHRVLATSLEIKEIHQNFAGRTAVQNIYMPKRNFLKTLCNPKLGDTFWLETEQSVDQLSFKDMLLVNKSVPKVLQMFSNEASQFLSLTEAKEKFQMKAEFKTGLLKEPKEVKHPTPTEFPSLKLFLTSHYKNYHRYIFINNAKILSALNN